MSVVSAPQPPFPTDGTDPADDAPGHDGAAPGYDGAAPGYDAGPVVRDSLARQAFLRLLGASATKVEPGHVVIELPWREDLCQQNGFVHAGVLTSVADSACGYAALTLMPEGSDVLSVGFSVNLLSPGLGDRFRADARVLRSGRTLTVCRAEVTALRDGHPDKAVAAMQATMITR
jgi:uncharacterized protein (TIGR00369 family)